MADTKLSAIASEAAPSVGDERLYIVTDLAGSPTSKYLKIGDVVYHSATAPTTPEDGFLWLETDTGILWTYGTYAAGSRWVTTSLFSFTAGTSGAVISASTWGQTPAGNAGYDLYLYQLYMKYHVLTTNNGSNYWGINLRKVTTTTVPASGAGSLLATILTNTGSAATWTDATPVSIDAVLDHSGAGSEILLADIIKTSSPGNLWLEYGYSYRYIHP